MMNFVFNILYFILSIYNLILLIFNNQLQNSPHLYIFYLGGFPGGSVGKVSAYNVGDPGLILGLGRFPGEGNGNPLQYSCLENPMD